MKAVRVLGSRHPSVDSQSIRLPGDKSITHRALLIAPMVDDSITVHGANTGSAVTELFGPLRSLGFRVEHEGTTVRLAREPVVDGAVPRLYVGGSSAAARLLIGVAAGRGGPVVVDGDAVLRARPMEWVVEPLRELGADIRYEGEPGRLPVAVDGPVRRSGTVELTVGSAQARAAVLTACVTAGLPVTLRHPVRSRDHTERLLAHLGADLDQSAEGVRYGGAPIRAIPELTVPADPSLVAYPAAVRLLSGGDATLEFPGVTLNPTRCGFFEVLRAAGADIRYRDVADRHGEPVGTIVVGGGLDGATDGVTVDDAAVLHSLIDEVPLLAGVATHLPRPSRIARAEELSFKETDRLVTTREMLLPFGARVRSTGDRIDVGPGPLRAAVTESFGDHRVAMAAVAVAAGLPGESVVRDGTCYRTSFPRFAEVMREAGVHLADDEPADDQPTDHESAALGEGVGT